MFSNILLGWILGHAFIGMTNLPQLQDSFYAILILNIVCWLVLWIFRTNQQVYLRIGLGLVAASVTFLLGLSHANRALQYSLLTKEWQSEHVSVVVYINQLNRITEQRIQQPLKVLNRHQKAVIWLASQKLDPQAEVIHFELGHYYRIQGSIRPIQSYANAGGFDSEKWFAEKRISAQIQLDHIEKLSINEVNQLGLVHHVRVHNSMRQKLLLSAEKRRLALRHFIQEQPLTHRGLALALLTGDESLLSKETEETFRRFGISHLLAISGPHVLVFAAMISALIHAMIGRFRPHYYLIYPKPYLLLIPFNLCVLAYCAFVGFEIPAVRTLLVSLSMSVLFLFRLQLSTFKVLLVSASLLLLYEPFSILSAAFWLSYGACFVLLRIYQTLKKSNSEQNKSPTFWQQSKNGLILLVESQWKIFIALLPLMCIFFKQVTWIAPISNLIAIPLIGIVIVPLDILAAIAFFIFKPLSAGLFQLNDLVIGFLLSLIQLLDLIIKPQLHWLFLNKLHIVLLSIGLILLFLPRGVVPKAWAVLCFIPLFFTQHSTTPFRLDILDVGQGQAIFLQVEQQRWMIDVGGYYDEEKFSVADRILLPYLASQGQPELNTVLLTHLDIDHSGALAKLQQGIQIQQLLSNEQLKGYAGIEFEYCYAGQIYRLNEKVTLKLLAPQRSRLEFTAFNKNENSCVVLIEIQQHPSNIQRILMMGDVGWETEYDLLAAYPELEVDYLVLGHHGSQHSSAYDFLAKVKPKFSIASASVNNRYGHPSEQVKARLEQLNIPLLTTAEKGAIRLSLNEQGQLQHQTYREQYLWSQQPQSMNDD
jgi:competence protein ComEC